MLNSNDVLTLVNDYLAHIAYERKPESLYEPIKYVLSLGGKRIRPSLLLLAYNLYKDDPKTVLPVACALETYHNYTLLHDDLMDNADLRRGHMTVHKRWNANTAILSGDSMLVLAFNQMLQCEKSKLSDILSLFTVTALEIGEGQQYDMDFENRNDVTESEYIEMIRLKTSVLLACATKMGAILAGASESDTERLYAFGEKLGLAFQLQDDFLDVYGDTKVFGKAIGGDILSNKKTYMLINALALADERQRNILQNWLLMPNPDPQEKIAAVTEIYNEIGINDLATEKIRFYFNESLKELDAVAIPDERKVELLAYTKELMKREY
ncbi:MAG: polyprenyl synthetase family protein [Prevotella sp.]|nr:polyprenyl synthetase family protein [Prevotella sp.]